MTVGLSGREWDLTAEKSDLADAWMPRAPMAGYGQRVERMGMTTQEPTMSDAQYFKALRAAVEDGDEQAAAVLGMLQSRGMIPPEFMPRA